MADAYRPKGSTSSSMKAAYGGKAKASRLTAPKNQQSPRSTPTAVLPRIDRLPQKPHAPSLLLSPTSTKNGGLSILLPRRPSTKDEIPSEETSPTFHGDEADGPSAKAAWCTPPNPVSELPTGSRVASFFAAPEGSSGYDNSCLPIATPLRLQSVEDNINANEERYRVDMERLVAGNDKFLEISTSANQHLEQIHSQLPSISDVFDQTACALHGLSTDIATLHEQHESAKNDMANRFQAAMSNNAEEMVTLSEAHANEKAELLQTHENELLKADEAFHNKVTELEDKYAEMEKNYVDELQELRQTTETRVQALRDSNRVEREERERSAKDTLEALQRKAQTELDTVRSSAEAAYRTSTDELAAVRQSLSAEISSLKQKAAANLAALAERSELELQSHREQSNEALQRLRYFYAKEREHLMEKNAEEVARLRMFELEQSSRMEERRCRETKSLQDEIEVSKTEYTRQIEDLHRRYTSEVEVLKVTSEAEKKLLLQTHASKTESIRSAAAQELAQTMASYEARLQQMSEAHAAEVTRNKEEARRAREALVSKYDASVASLQNERSREKYALILRYETERESVKQANREEHDKTVKLQETQVAQLREAHASRVLALEMAMREQNKQTEDTIREKDAELDSRKERIRALENTEIALNERHNQFVERSRELIEQKNMALSELESEIWRLDQLNVEKDSMLDSTNRALKTAEEELQVKANTILELTFVVKSRDDEIEKLRNALLDTVQTVNTKTEILELTTETLSSKAKELEATKNALRLESGKLSMVEESMSQKVGMLENSELKMESMRLNLENMRLEMKRMQMDMKLQLEHTEGEIELKNGEIRRLQGAQSELKQKNDFSQQTIERLEQALASAQRQGEEGQRRIELLRLETAQAAEDVKKACDELLGKEQELVIMTREKQAVATEKQRLQIQFNNLTHVAQRLDEKVELHAMQAEEIQCQYQKLLQETTAERDERIRTEKHLHMLELSAAKDAILHLEGIEERLTETNLKLETTTSEKQQLEDEINVLRETLKKYEDTDRQLCAANEEIAVKNGILEEKRQELVDLDSELLKAEDKAKQRLGMSRMETEDSMSSVYRLESEKEELSRLNSSLGSSLASLGHEKREIVSRADDLQEKIAGLRKEASRATREISDLQHALSEKKRELEYLQENLGEQTTDTRKVKIALDTLGSSHSELQTQLIALREHRQQENDEHRDTIQALQQSLEGKTKQCGALQQSLDIQRQEIDLLMVQHDSQVTQLTDGHRSEAVQLIESHRAQLAQVKEDHQDELSRLTADHRGEVSCLTQEQESETRRLKGAHQVEIDRVTDDLHVQIAELTIDGLSRSIELTEEHHAEVDRLKQHHEKEVATLAEANRSELTRLDEVQRVAVARLISELTVERLSFTAEQTVEHRSEVSRLTEERHSEITHLAEEHSNEIARLTGGHSSDLVLLRKRHQDEVDRLADAHRHQVSELTVDELSHLTEQTEEHQNEVARLAETQRMEKVMLTEEHTLQISALSEDHAHQISKRSEKHQAEIAQLEQERDSLVVQLKEEHQSEVDRLRTEQYDGFGILQEEYEGRIQQIDANRAVNQQQVLLKQTADDQIRGLCAQSLERMITHVTHEHEIKSMEQSLSCQLELLRSEHTRVLERLVSEHSQEVLGMQQQQREVEKEAARQSAQERYDQHNGTLAESTELLRLRLTEEHLTKVNELLERSRAEEERHAAVLTEVRGELSNRSNALKAAEEVIETLKMDIKELLTQLQETRTGVSERDAVVVAKNATIENVRKELNLLLETSKSTRSSEQFMALLRQQLETHLMEVYHVEMNELEGFVLEEEGDLIGCLKGLFAMRCYRGVAPQGPDGRPESRRAVTDVEEVRLRLQEYDRMVSAVEHGNLTPDSDDTSHTPSGRIASSLKELEVLKHHVRKMFVPTNTDAWMDLLGNLTGLFERLAIPTQLESAFIRSRQIITMFDEHEKLMSYVNSSSVKDIRTVEDIGRLFTVIDHVLARSKQVTGSDQFARLEDVTVLFDEWEALHRELDDSNSAQTTLEAGNYLRSAEILASREEYAAFIQRCKDALLVEDDMWTVEDIVEAIEQLMQILQHFERLQPKLGSPRRPSAADPHPTLANKVTAVLGFVEELQLMADFAQNILTEETKSDADPVSNASSRSSLEMLRALTRTPSPTQTLEDLQIEVDLVEADANLCEFSNNEGDIEREDFFEEKTSSRSPSPFLADSLMEISLVMSDHHRLLSQTARYIAQSRQGEARNNTFSVGTEISRLVREHCALLSLSRRLFKLQDPRQELASLLEGLALLERMTGRLALFQRDSARDAGEASCLSFGASESATSLLKSASGSVGRPVLASIGEMARHLQDYDYFLQQVKVDAGQESHFPTAINIEALVQVINERVELVEQTKELLGLQNPVEELQPFLVGAQEVLRQAKQIREASVFMEKRSVDEGKSGVEAVLGEMDAVVEDLRSYNGMLAWLHQVLPHPESMNSVADLKDRMSGVLRQVEALTTSNTCLVQDKTSLRGELEQLKVTQDHLVEESSKEGALLQELAVLEAQALLSPMEEVSTRIELVQALIKQQQRACDDAQQRRADLKMETEFLRRHNLLSDGDAVEVFSLSMSARLEVYNELLVCADNLRSEKDEVERTLNAEKEALESRLQTEKETLEATLREEIQHKAQRLESVEGELAQSRLEMEAALAEERVFLESKPLFSSLSSLTSHTSGGFSRIEIYQQLHDELARLLDAKEEIATCATQEFEFLRANELLPPAGEIPAETSIPSTSALSSLRLGVFNRLVDARTQLRQFDDELVQESRFLEKKFLEFDPDEPLRSRLAVYETLLASQSALIEEKMEREVALESEKAFLGSHGVPAFESPMEIYEQFVQARKQLADLTTELAEELRFLANNQLYSSNEMTEESVKLTTPFSSSFRLLVYRNFMESEVQARETTRQLKEDLEQELSMRVAADERVIRSLTAKVERLESSLMQWQESACASQVEWDRMLLEEEEKRRSLIRRHEETQKQVLEDHCRALEEVTKARDSAVALASATHAEALEEAVKEHERKLAAELYKQAQQLELAAFVRTENEGHKQTSDTLIPHASSTSARAQLLEKFAKRDTTAISMIYKVIRLTTDILSAAPATSVSRTVSGNTSEMSTDVTHAVLACVKELKTLKEFLVQSLEQVAKDDDHIPAPFAKWMADAVTRATADKECAIDLALCSHREFMSFAEVQLLSRQEEVEKALARVYEKLQSAAINGGFSPGQERVLALELDVTREKEARENVACKFRLNEEYYRRLLDERKEMETAQTANVEALREECKELRLKLERLEQVQHQTQFRPPSSNTYTFSPRLAVQVISPQAPRVLKTAAISNVPMPMRPERPRGVGSAHKERFVSDLERETGQRRTNTSARRFNEWRAREESITETPGSQLEEDFRAMQAAMASHHAPALEPVVPTVLAAPATAPGSSLQNQELWCQGVRSIHSVSFFVSIFHVPKQQLFRVEIFNSDTEQQQQTVYVTWVEMQTFVHESRKATRLGIVLPADPEMAVTVPQQTRVEIMGVLFERVRVYGEGTENILLGFE
ncbi:hypothetical protein V7S43_011055 [Phytophthora oleae]|uniref:Uncharacterized protein n=1 Tax=Phytophthora oleae TaxID=2107226 RepID=A0ABD3FGQ0_9STRA